MIVKNNNSYVEDDFKITNALGVVEYNEDGSPKLNISIDDTEELKTSTTKEEQIMHCGKKKKDNQNRFIRRIINI